MERDILQYTCIFLQITHHKKVMTAKHKYLVTEKIKHLELIKVSDATNLMEVRNNYDSHKVCCTESQSRIYL